MHNPFRYFNSSPEVIRYATMMYIRYPLSLRQVEDIPFERGIDTCHENLRFWWNRFGPIFAGKIRKRRVDGHNWSNWRRHQKFTAVHASIYNHFNHRRHLPRRNTFKQLRAAALVEWRQLAA